MYKNLQLEATAVSRHSRLLDGLIPNSIVPFFPLKCMVIKPGADPESGKRGGTLLNKVEDQKKKKKKKKGHNNNS